MPRSKKNILNVEKVTVIDVLMDHINTLIGKTQKLKN